MTTIFLSHNHQDKPFVRELASYLRRYGVRVWVDEAEIKVGESLTEKVGGAIKENEFLGVVISKNSVDSPWVKKELQVALQRELRENRVVILPILLDNSEIPPFLLDKLYADFSSPDKFYTSLGRVVDALGCLQKPGPRSYISYSHDSNEQKDWVANLFRRLVFDGVNATFDYSFMQPGKDFWDAIFLELARTNFVVLIGTHMYKLKAEGIEPGGLKREYDEIVRQARLRSDLQVIPALREGMWPHSIPQQFAGRFGIDMRNYPPDEEAYQQLLERLK